MLFFYNISRVRYKRERRRIRSDAAESPSQPRMMKNLPGKDAALFGAMQTGRGGASPVGGAVRACMQESARV